MGSSMTVVLMRGPKTENIGDKSTVEVTFEKYPNHTFFKNYHLFSWLAGVREGLVPRKDRDFWHGNTQKFFEMLDSIRRNEDPKARPALETIGMDEHTVIMYPTDALVAFNYDQVQMTPDGLEPNGYTYRDQFENDFLPILEYAVTHNWNYVIFGFD